MKASGFPNLMNGNRYINQFDFPTINEAYRGKEVMYNALLLGGYENDFAFLVSSSSLHHTNDRKVIKCFFGTKKYLYFLGTLNCLLQQGLNPGLLSTH